MSAEIAYNKNLNAICPYFTMFPLDFPLGILEPFSSPNDWVFDPFCGRGTTNYASRLSGLQSIGIDSSPVAVAITEAKLSNVLPNDIITEANRILNSVKEPKEIPSGEFWNLAYDGNVLRNLCKIRESLLENCVTETQKALRGLMLGGLHGPRRKVGSFYFSNQCQRTYAPKPNYAINYWKKKQFQPPQVNVIEVVTERAKKFFINQPKSIGKIILADSRNSEVFSNIEKKVKWVITSPPYYGLKTYIPDQWLRMWFLGGKSSVDYSADNQLKHSSQKDFADDLAKVWKNTATICSDDAKMIVRFGSINERKVNATELIKLSFENTGWQCVKIESAGTATKGHRQAKHMNKQPAEAREEFDIWAELEH